MDATNGSHVDETLTRLRTALRAAMKRRDSAAVSGLRSAMAAVANAEAVDITDAPTAGAIETSPVGVGSTEVARRVLTHADVHAILQTEVAEHEQALRILADHCRRRAIEFRL